MPSRTADPLLSNDNRLILDDCVFLAGNCPYEDQVQVGGGSILVYASSKQPIALVCKGWSTTQRACYYMLPDYKYDTEYIKELALGQRYTLVLRFDPLTTDIDFNSSESKRVYEYPVFSLYDCLTDYWCPAIWPNEKFFKINRKLWTHLQNTGMIRVYFRRVNA